jgi:glycerophosphoryl diester phosphodiesterase
MLLSIFCVLSVAAFFVYAQSNPQAVGLSTTPTTQADLEFAVPAISNNVLVMPGTSTPVSSWVDIGLVAHAGGTVGNVQGTNTIEAVQTNYELGHRVFELDFNLTSDGKLVGIHDWGGKAAKSWDEFSSKQVSGLFTPTSLEMFLDFLEQHEDAYIITDTKSFDYTDEQITEQFQILFDAASVRPELRERIIVQVYNQKMYHLINKIYKYPNILYTLYMTPDTEAQVVEFVRSENIPVIVMPPERANQPFLSDIYAAGAKVFLHTLNDINDIKAWLAKGVSGFYTDDILPEQLVGLNDTLG